MTKGSFAICCFSYNKLNLILSRGLLKIEKISYCAMIQRFHLTRISSKKIYPNMLRYFTIPFITC